MTILVLTGTGNTLTCTPPNSIETEGKQVALVYFSETKPRILVSADFIYESPFNSGTKRILGVNNLSGPPFYVKLKPNVTEFQVHLLKPDLTPYEAKKTLIAILHIQQDGPSSMPCKT